MCREWLTTEGRAKGTWETGDGATLSIIHQKREVNGKVEVGDVRNETAS